MKCKIIVVIDEQCDFENKINDFIKNKNDCHVSISSTRYFSGNNVHTQFVACITYSN